MEATFWHHPVLPKATVQLHPKEDTAKGCKWQRSRPHWGVVRHGARQCPSPSNCFEWSPPKHSIFIQSFYLADILSTAFFWRKLSGREEEERTVWWNPPKVYRCSWCLSSPPLPPGILAGESSNILAGILSGICLPRFCVFEVWWGTLWSWACCSGPAGNTVSSRLQWRSGEAEGRRSKADIKSRDLQMGKKG